MTNQRYIHIIKKSVVTGAVIRVGVLLRYMRYEANDQEIFDLESGKYVKRVSHYSLYNLTGKGLIRYALCHNRYLENSLNDYSKMIFKTSDKICNVNNVLERYGYREESQDRW